MGFLGRDLLLDLLMEETHPRGIYERVDDDADRTDDMRLTVSAQTRGREIGGLP